MPSALSSAQIIRDVMILVSFCVCHRIAQNVKTYVVADAIGCFEKEPVSSVSAVTWYADGGRHPISVSTEDCNNDGVTFCYVLFIFQ